MDNVKVFFNNTVIVQNIDEVINIDFTDFGKKKISLQRSVFDVLQYLKSLKIENYSAEEFKAYEYIVKEYIFKFEELLIGDGK